ncbi:MAG: 1-deoxy-D-xylulose-5-phosphate reductoisomerase [Proteobacteria bacterium]|nr:1-deoxy-D-xylulose-5-phosphate reductoisomerase [Pseudomonadota bacterium]
MVKNLVILGATGSIGDSTLDIVVKHPEKFNVYAITGHSNVEKLSQLARQFKPRYVVVSDKGLYASLKSLLADSDAVLLAGEDELINICQLPEVDMVVAGIVGSAGMNPVLATVEAGKDLLLANKEALVVAGDLVMQAAIENGANIIPLDSEHNAIYQCLPDDYRVGNCPKNLSKIILTASGGPFWNMPAQEFSTITPAQACVHPNWDMGRKISVDSATMMNKGLEIIEAHWLFNLPTNKIDIHVHPQSIIHSMVCYQDGSVLAQIGEPDMRIPIAYGLGLRKRINSGANLVDLLHTQSLDFFAPDYEKFPCLKIAQDAIKQGGTAAAILNAANEVTVEAFLNKKIAFTQIATINHKVMTKVTINQVESVSQLQDLDIEIRSMTQQMVKLNG